MLPGTLAGVSSPQLPEVVHIALGMLSTKLQISLRIKIQKLHELSLNDPLNK